MISAGGTTAGRKRPIRVSLLLDLARLGPVRADLEIGEQSVTGGLLADRAETLAAFHEQQGRLVDALTARGFTTVNIAIRPFPAHERRPETLAETLVPAGQGLIDVRI